MDYREFAYAILDEGAGKCLDINECKAGDADPAMIDRINALADEYAELLRYLVERNVVGAEPPTEFTLYEDRGGDYRKNWHRMNEIDAASRDKGTILGRYVQKQIADGYAYYQIVQAMGSKVQIVRVTGVGDDWTEPTWGDVAWIDREFAVANINRRDTLNSMFAERRVP